LPPASQSTGWFGDGELDLVTLTLPPRALKSTTGVGAILAHARSAVSRIPWGAICPRQVLAELYASAAPERDLSFHRRSVKPPAKSTHPYAISHGHEMFRHSDRPDFSSLSACHHILNVVIAAIRKSLTPSTGDGGRMPGGHAFPFVAQPCFFRRPTVPITPSLRTEDETRSRAKQKC